MAKDSPIKGPASGNEKPTNTEGSQETLGAWLGMDSLVAYSPYWTYSDPSDRQFRDRDAKPVRDCIDNPDTDTLWKIGYDAYEMLAIKGRDDFLNRYSFFRDAIKMWRSFIEEIAAKGRLNDQNGQRLDVSRLALDHREASEILNLLWQILDQMAKDGIVVRDEARAEHFLFACLIEIDNALVGMNLDGRAAITSAVAAANALANAQAVTGGSEVYQKARRHMAFEAAVARHRSDPKQADKKFVFQCYQKWRANPARYKSKAQFARDMLDKCAHLESQKKIEDWVRVWDREPTSGTLPAE